MKGLRDEIYWWSLELIENGLKLQGIFLLLSTWNFAYFRFHLVDFDLERFERVLRKCDFEYFKGKKFETLNLFDLKVVQKIKDIYSKLSKVEGISYVGATKVMHLLNPRAFMMWDTCIRKFYRAKTTPDGYLEFMREMQARYRTRKFKNLKSGVTVPRAIDLYNMKKCRQK
ncbi:MAG: hypothetical protein HY070_05705 [Chloroflexi bacterium]|nr:hypothetical protein [Chloroflexota bacterium]